MNTTMSAPTSLHEHPPQQLQPSHSVRRVRLFDRLALRLGLALLVWARRPVRRHAVTERYITEAEVAELREARYSSYHLLTLIR